MTACEHASSGCDYPAGECSGACMVGRSCNCDALTWEEFVRASRAAGFIVTGRWENGAPVLIRMH